MNTLIEFDDVDSIRDWCSRYYNGHEIYEHKYKGEELVAIVGMPTCGVETSQVLLFQLMRGKYRVLSFVNTLAGYAAVKASEDVLSIVYENVDGIRFSLKGLFDEFS